MPDTLRPARYDRVSIWLHWLMAIILIAGFFIAENTGHNNPAATGYTLHVSLGMALLALTVFRVFWRLAHKAPADPPGTTGLQSLAAKVVKIAFYVVMLVLPLSGWIAHFDEFGGGVTGNAQTMVFWLFPLPQLPVTGMGDVMEELHEIASHAWLPLLGLHVAAALWHHFVRKDDVLKRMLPAGRG